MWDSGVLQYTIYLLVLTLIGLCPLKSQTKKADVIIYGGTSAGVLAAVQVKRMGKTVMIVSPDTHLGGLSSSGLGWTDTGKKQVIGGIAREFYHRVWRHYQASNSWNAASSSPCIFT